MHKSFLDKYLNSHSQFFYSTLRKNSNKNYRANPVFL